MCYYLDSIKHSFHALHSLVFFDFAARFSFETGFVHREQASKDDVTVTNQLSGGQCWRRRRYGQEEEEDEGEGETCGGEDIVRRRKMRVWGRPAEEKLCSGGGR